MPLKSYDVETMPEFIRLTETYSYGRVRRRLYRGQCVRGNLLPGVARTSPTTDTTSNERESLRQFQLMGHSLLAGIGVNTLGLLVLAQHHGLKTRLLDWSSNPLVALYFACSARPDCDVFVYMLDADGFEEARVYDSDPFLQKYMCVVQPYLNNPRVLAQHGWFTLHPYDADKGRFVAVEHSADMDACTIEIRIPQKCRSAMRESLRNLGIDSHTVMPDLGGLSQHLNERLEL